ncbi:hypothetical protein A1O7_06947 [Cladophialophora yegresii CBS 114405]|uniref:Uncharacterized protein n=1 Tax=Cladophialophora yegresii CBS 114405 TaxID=1182544 RepID=W9VM57_9EURO|nr:uncharacterized protein A1O7_06947 [Cladophialophora yegresii CBS 114405]EXJ56603.1 hypothetical protein A1O7_06947 [Cladophialophora yegresii CBS 114405]
MADSPKPPTLLTIPPEIRLRIWEFVFDELHYFGAVSHDGCRKEIPPEEYIEEDSKEIVAEQDSDDIVDLPPKPLQPCSCNDRQLLPLYLCRQTYGEMKEALKKAPITAEYTVDPVVELKPTFVGRIHTLILDGTVFPILYPRILGRVDYDDIEWVFPGLKRIVLPEGLGSGLGLRFPSSIPMHIYSCLRESEGPTAMPTADMTGIVRSDLSGHRFTEGFHATEALVRNAGIEISSTYRYTVAASEILRWPFDTERDIYEGSFAGEITWDKTSMRISDLPDLRGEWWFDEWLIDDGRLPLHQKIDWTSELGGWDMMNLFDRTGDERTIWLETHELSNSFT